MAHDRLRARAPARASRCCCCAPAAGRAFFAGASALVGGLTTYTNAGARFVFGPLIDSGFSFVANVLPVIVFMGSLFAILYHLGIVQQVVGALAWGMSRTLGTSGAESLAAVANIFVGMTEAPLLVRPYLARMTRSELFAVMTIGMATVAGSVLVAYAAMLGADYAGHLAHGEPALGARRTRAREADGPRDADARDRRSAATDVDEPTVNVFDAAAEGAIAGLRLAAYVGALLVAFVALIAMANDALGGRRRLGRRRGTHAPARARLALRAVRVADGRAGGRGDARRLAARREDGAERVPRLPGARRAGSPRDALAALGRDRLLRALRLRELRLARDPARRARRHGAVAARRDRALGLRSILAGTLATCMAACWAGILL